MRCVQLLFICLISLLSVSRTNCQDSWRDFIPLKTTRTQVEKVLGPPVSKKGRKPLDTFRWYNTELGVINVWYSSGKCEKTDSLRWKVGAGIVTRVELVQPKREASLKDWGFNVGGYKKEQHYMFENRFFYTSPDETLVIQTVIDRSGNETLYSVFIQPGIAGEQFLCPKFVEIVSNVVEVIFSYPPVSPLEMVAS